MGITDYDFEPGLHNWRHLVRKVERREQEKYAAADQNKQGKNHPTTPAAAKVALGIPFAGLSYQLLLLLLHVGAVT